MNILVINCGSSSLKFQVMDPQSEEVKAKGIVERIGIEDSRLKYEPTGQDELKIDQDIKDHTQAIDMVIKTLTDSNHGVIDSMEDIQAVGHRVVHGGEEFSESVLIDDDVMAAIENNARLAPLHNPANIMGIKACQELMPNIDQVAVFDTAFHQTMDEDSYIYAIPYEYYEKYKIRRYGFHGTSHKYVSQRAAKLLGKESANLITCHLGNGGSITAVKDGKSIDTSMGLTPLEGIVMGTRSGSIDPAILPFIANEEDLSLGEVDNILNKKSGVLGISGLSSDFRDLEEAADKGNHRAQLALDVFVNAVSKYIGAYMTQLDYVDAIVFTAGVGENSPFTRQAICDKLKIFGVELDQEENSKRGEDLVVSTDESSIKVLVIPTDEELVIAQDTYKLTK